MTFAEWLDERYTTLAADYRRQLSWIANTCRGYAEGNIWESRHTAIAIELLRGVSRGTLGTHPQWDEAYKESAKKPDGDFMLQQAIWDVEKLENVPGESR